MIPWSVKCHERLDGSGGKNGNIFPMNLQSKFLITKFSLGIFQFLIGVFPCSLQQMYCDANILSVLDTDDRETDRQPPFSCF